MKKFLIDFIGYRYDPAISASADFMMFLFRVVFLVLLFGIISYSFY